MRHEIGCGHVTRKNKGNQACIRANDQEDAANDLDCALDVEKRRHLWTSRRKAEIFLQTALKEQQCDDDTQDTQDIGLSLFEFARSDVIEASNSLFRLGRCDTQPCSLLATSATRRPW